MPESDARDLDLLLRAARSAGEVAMAHAQGPLDITHKPDDAGPVTQADLAVNARLETMLRGARPDYGWLSEESETDPARAGASAVFVVDPIDGTRSFIDRARTWGISVAVVRAGVPVAGVVHMPALDRTYAAHLGGGASRDGQTLQARRGPGVTDGADAADTADAPDALTLDQAEVLATRPTLEPRHWRGAVPVFQRHHRPSLAYRMCLVAEGRFDAMFTFRASWEWDIAAGALICAEAGARVTDADGAPLVFNNALPQTRGVITARPVLHADIMARRALGSVAIGDR